jgi:hypothetical protein
MHCFKETTCGGSFFRAIERAVVFSMTQRDDEWWSIFVSGDSMKEDNNIFFISKTRGRWR